MGGGVQPVRSFTSCSTATPIRLGVNRHDGPIWLPRAQVTIGDPSPLPEPDCTVIGDVFALPPGQ